MTLVFAQAIQNLHAAILTATQASGATVYDGEVPMTGTLSLPWVVLQDDLPAVSDRALAATAQAYQVRIRTTVCAANSTATHIVATKVMQALEYARISPDGWSCGPILQVGSRSLGTDLDYVVPGSTVHPVVTVLDWSLTASLRP